ncbi:MAG: Gfo/Idh/MocA family oxidoreductase [Lachnospiraceae bacterium]|nr:Gfo/Idh/MocA family oxidoreductase [Lachnospiraceae bacterium]
MQRIGIVGTANIADSRFLPALKQCDKFEYIGLAGRNQIKVDEFVKKHGGKSFYGYDTIISRDITDSLYLPLPPALHYEWGRKCLEKDIHVFMEKPFATCFQETYELIELARKNRIVLYENYMFLYHKQLAVIKEILFEKKLLGDLRLIRINFAFPHKSADDFRYNKQMGGGALLDCGGYTARLAMELLDDKIEVKTANLNLSNIHNVDLFGSATLQDKNGLVAQLAFGMDNGYKCELEVVGQKGWLKTGRIFTAPPELDVEIALSVDNENQKIVVERDNQFLNSIHTFYSLLEDDEKREGMYTDILNISKLVEEIRLKGL